MDYKFERIEIIIIQNNQAGHAKYLRTKKKFKKLKKKRENQHSTIFRV